MSSPAPDSQAPQATVELAYRSLLAPTPVPSVIVYDGRVDYVNGAALRVFQAAAESDLIGRSLFDIIDPSSHDTARRRLEIALTKGEPAPPVEQKYLRVDGIPVEVEVAAWPVPYRSGSALVITFVDITERKRAEEALRNREAQLQLVIDGVPGLVSYVDSEFRYRFVNSMYATWFGKPASSFTGRTVPEVLGEQAFSSVRPEMQLALAGKVVRFERTLAYKDGKSRHVRATYVPDTAPDGKVRGFVVLVEDVSDRKKAEHALQESEERFRVMADNAPVLVWMTGTDKLASWFNRPWLAFRGRPLDRETGTGYLEGIHPEDLGRFQSTFTNAFESGSPFTLEYRIQRHDGVYRWVLDHGVPLFDPSGLFTGFIGSCVDITGRKTAEQALQTSETRYRTLFETTREGILIVDDEGHYVDVNESYCRILRAPREKLIGAHFSRFIPPDRLEEAKRAFAELRTGGVTPVDFPLRALDGSIVELEWTSSSQFLPGLSCCACRDVTERKRAQQALQAREEEARTLLAALPDIVSRFDRELRFVYMSPAVERSTGLPPSHFIGKTHMEAGLPEDVSAHLRSSLKHIFDSGQQDVVEFDLMSPHGLRHFMGIGVPEYGPDGTVTSALSIVRDITERKQNEEALREANVLLKRANANLEQFAYSASHDLREPIRMVSIYAQLLKKKYRGHLDADADQYIDFAVEGAQRMNLLVSDLLAYTRASSAPDEPIPATEAGAALAHATRSLTAAVEESGASITSHSLPAVRMHPTQLEQVFQNLLSNAIKYRGEEPPRIHVAVQQHPGGCVFSVKDNGIGIDEAYADHIFGLFKRLHTAGEYPGTGMGLAICRNIVERYGGRIWVESTPGQGSTFLFSIPDES